MLIGEIAERTGVTKEAVRHYVDIGHLKPSPKRAGTRIYQDFSGRHVERLKWIVLGKSAGFSLSEINTAREIKDRSVIMISRGKGRNPRRLDSPCRCRSG